MKAQGLLLALGLGLSVAVLAIAEDTKAKSPELQVLDRYVGTWEETTVSKPALWTSERSTTTTTSTRRWILNGAMIENKGAWQPGDKEFLHLMCYDSNQKEYRQWYFDKETSPPMVSQGKWDEASMTFTFRGSLSDDVQVTSQQHFTDKDHFTWTLVAKDKSGQVVLDMEGKCARKK